LRWTFLGSAKRKPNFLAAPDRLNGGVPARVETVSSAFC
jgi:hypothetical protein